MITTEASSTTMSWATAMTARALKRLGSPSGWAAKSWSGRSKVVVMWGAPVSWVVPIRPEGSGEAPAEVGLDSATGLP